MNIARTLFGVKVQDSRLERSRTFMKSERSKKRGRPTSVQRLVDTSRVTKVVKGGKKTSFRALVVVGDMQGRVGVGVGKGNDVKAALNKGITDGNKNMITVPLTPSKSIPHPTNGRFGAARVILRPSSPGSGVLAGGSPRVVLEAVGITHVIAKQLGSNNLMNNARATIAGLKSLKA
jgi:small subunit ribosomal protein S5